jgi:nucleoporin POM152
MPPQPQSGHEAQRRALIPSSRMEFPIQRRWAFSIFVLLQAWKAADLLVIFTATYPEQYNSYLAKWWFIDSIYLVALHVAKIPWLQFTVLKTTFLIFLLMFVNFIVFALPIVRSFKQLEKC